MRTLLTLLYSGLLLFCQPGFAAENALDEKLRVFEPYLGTWQADFPVAPGKPPVRDVSRWERALNGTAIRTLHSINDGQYGGESLIFWDKKTERLVFYYFTTAGFYTQGHLEVRSPQSFAAYEDVNGNDSGITRVESTSEFQNDAFTVSTRYFKNGAWTAPESRTYTRSQREVVFK